jgi:hypothetical protein
VHSTVKSRGFPGLCDRIRFGTSHALTRWKKTTLLGVLDLLTGAWTKQSLMKPKADKPSRAQLPQWTAKDAETIFLDHPIWSAAAAPCPCSTLTRAYLQAECPECTSLVFASPTDPSEPEKYDVEQH